MSRLQELFGMSESDLPTQFRYVLSKSELRLFKWRGELIRHVARASAWLAHWIAVAALRRLACRLQVWQAAVAFASTYDNAVKIERLMIDAEQRGEKIRGNVRRMLEEKRARETAAADDANPFSEPSAMAKATEAAWNLTLAFSGLGGGPDVNSRIRIASMRDSAELCLTLGIAWQDFALDHEPPDTYKIDYLEAAERTRLRRALSAQGDSAITSSGVHGTQEQLKR